MRSFLQDLQFAVRTLRRRRTFAAVAIATIALGVGATTSMYSVVDGVLLKPLPFREPDRLVRVRQVFFDWKDNPVLSFMWDRIPVGMDEYENLRDHSTVFQSVGLWGVRSPLLTGRGAPERVWVTLASATLLNVVDVRPVRGRGINAGEDVLGGPKVALLGFDEWMTRFGGSEDVLKQSVVLDDVPYQIVGVLPKGFKLNQRDLPIRYWVPIGQEEQDRGHGNRSYDMLARLKPGVTMARAELEARAILEEIAPQGRKGARLADWQVEQTREVRKPLFVLLGAVALLMVIACVNVATLLLGEASAREQEMAARVALGAGRARLVRQLLTESIALSAVGSATGTLLAWWGTRAMMAIAPERVTEIGGAHLDLRVLAFSAALAIATGVVFGLAPALTLSRNAPASLVRSGSGQSAAGRGRLQRAFIAVQLALSLVLLLGASLLGQSLLRLTSVDPGFRDDHLLAVRIPTPKAVRADSLLFRPFQSRVMERLAALPGVVGVAATSTVPFDGSSSTFVEIEGHSTPAGSRGPEVQQRTVSPNYFSLMGIPLVAGRAFGPDDRTGGDPVVVVSEAMARRDWPREQAVGKRVKYKGAWRTVIGVVHDIKFRTLAASDQPTLYTPTTQFTSGGSYLLRTTVPPASVAGAVRAAILALDPMIAGGNIEPVEGLVQGSFADERFRTILVTIFGLLALVLAAVGMYGVAARAVARRTREVGIRVALGASAPAVVWLIVRSSLGGVGIGAAAGLVLAFAGAQWADDCLFQVGARDPATYAGVIAFLAAVAVVASWLPARRAASVHPAVVLRGE